MLSNRSALPFFEGHLKWLWLLASLPIVVILLTNSNDELAAPQYPSTEFNTQEGDTVAETLNTLVVQVETLEEKLKDTVDALHKTLATRAISPAVTHSEATVQIDIREALSALANRLTALEKDKQAAKPLSTATVALPVYRLQQGTITETTKDIAPDSAIPAGSIFFDAIALTALLGRVPIEGAVHAPYPVKVLVGSENIAPGGAVMPELKGVVMSGTAVGDLLMRCVSVSLHALNFVLADNTIFTAGNNAPQANARLGSGIGWLSDEAGIPCIQGTLIDTDRSLSVAAKALLAGARGYASARQTNELSSITSAEGNVLQVLTGDALDHNRAASLNAVLGSIGGVDLATISAQVQNNKAIYVPPATKVIVHISKQINSGPRTNAYKLLGLPAALPQSVTYANLD